MDLEFRNRGRDEENQSRGLRLEKGEDIKNNSSLCRADWLNCSGRDRGGAVLTMGHSFPNCTG